MRTGGLHDKTVDLDTTPEQLAGFAALLGSRTRLAVLRALTRARGPLNINEVARRVGVDASPVRTHLMLLVKAGVVREFPGTGRERRFETTLVNARLILEGVHRPRAPEKDVAPSKAVKRLERKLETVDRQMRQLAEKARAYERDLDAEWARLAKDAA